MFWGWKPPQNEGLKKNIKKSLKKCLTFCFCSGKIAALSRKAGAVVE